MTRPSRTVPVLVEAGSKKVFATALTWPGWSRGAKTEEEALEALEHYASRYRRSMGSVGARFGFPHEPVLEVVERLDGGKGTDFGVPEIVAECDLLPLVGQDLRRNVALLRAAWRAFDKTVAEHAGRDLEKGPRGGGRDIDQMVEHVHGADQAFALPIGAVLPKASEGEPTTDHVRKAFVAALEDRAAARPHATGRRTKKVWPPRYAVRRSAWHSLDHAWEIEDKVIVS